MSSLNALLDTSPIKTYQCDVTKKLETDSIKWSDKLEITFGKCMPVLYVTPIIADRGCFEEAKVGAPLELKVRAGRFNSAYIYQCGTR